jgi:hypothetical protein
MAKRQPTDEPTRKTTPPVEQPETLDKETTTFSVRLTDQQSDLIRRAAEIRGWSPTALIRNAALERAAHIFNTSRPNQFDFWGLAQSLAETLFKNRNYRFIVGDSEDPEFERPVDDINKVFAEMGATTLACVEAEPDRLGASALGEISRALRLGGAEFLRMVVERCEAMTASERKSELREPVDPASLGAGDRS